MNIWRVLILKNLLILFWTLMTMPLECMDQTPAQVLVVDFTQLRTDRARMLNAFESGQFESALDFFQKVSREREKNLEICRQSESIPEGFFTSHHNENIQDHIVGASSSFKVGTAKREISYFDQTLKYSKLSLENLESPLDHAVYKNVVFQYAMSQSILFYQDHTYPIDFHKYLDPILEMSQDPSDFMKCIHVYTGLQDYAKILTLDQKIRDLIPAISGTYAQELHQKQSFMGSIAESFFPDALLILREERLKISTLSLLGRALPTEQLKKIETLRLNTKMLFETKQYLSAFQKFQELHRARTFYCTHQTIPDSLQQNFLDHAYEELINAYTCALAIEHHSFIQTTAAQTLENKDFNLEKKKPLLHRLAISTLITGNILKTLEYISQILQNPSLADLIVCDYLYIGLGPTYNGNIHQIETSIKEKIRKVKTDKIISTIKETNFLKEIIIGHFKDNNHKTSNTFKMISSFYIFKTLKMYQKPLNIDKIWEMALKRQDAYTFFQNSHYAKVIELLNQIIPVLKSIKRNFHLPEEEGINTFLEKLQLLIEKDEQILKDASENHTPPEWSDSDEELNSTPIEKKKGKKKGKKKKKKKEAQVSTTIEEELQIPLKPLEKLSIRDEQPSDSEHLKEKKKRVRTKPKKTKEERQQAKAQKEATTQQPAQAVDETDLISSDDEDDGIIFITTPKHHLTKEAFEEQSSQALALFLAQQYDEAAVLFNHIMEASLPWDVYRHRRDLRPHHAISNLYSVHKDKFFLEEKFFTPLENVTLAKIFEHISLSYTHEDDYYIWKECLFMAGRSYVNAAQSSTTEHYQVSHYLTASDFFNRIQDIPNASKGYFSAAETIDISLVKSPEEAINKTFIRRNLYLRARAGFISYNDTHHIEKIDTILAIEFSQNPVAGFLKQNKISAAKKRRYNEIDFELVRDKIEEDERKEREAFRKRLREEDERDHAEGL